MLYALPLVVLTNKLRIPLTSGVMTIVLFGFQMFIYHFLMILMLVLIVVNSCFNHYLSNSVLLFKYVGITGIEAVSDSTFRLPCEYCDEPFGACLTVCRIQLSSKECH